MKILTVGDVCGNIGCLYLQKTLPKIKRENKIDLTIVNGENSADGNGITPLSADSLFAAGADVITGGNHSLRRREVFGLLDENPFLLRPHNIVTTGNGKGYCEVDLGHTKVAVINLAGRVYMPEATSPFDVADQLIDTANSNGIKNIIIDFHAEATSEKRALAEYLRGRVSAIFGTHTHVPTADLIVLDSGTGFITDIGMTGPVNSVLGVKTELSLARIKDETPVKFILADGKCRLDACIFDIDQKNGKCVSAKRFSVKEV
jgi:metallophosphoesterase (TIGR00282 family)